MIRGMDIDCGSFLQEHTATALKSGKLKEEEIDRALFNLFSVLVRVGFFDGNPLSNQKYGNLGPGFVCTPEHRQLALEAVRQGIVLLKNDENFLPLNRKEVASLAVIGPSANDTRILNGDYAGVPCERKTLLHDLQSYVPDMLFAAGCINTICTSEERFHEAIRVAREVDHIVVVAGLNLTEETEELDRVTLLLPGHQMDLVNAIASVSKNPIVLVLMGGGPIDVSFAKENPRIASILWIGYPGEIGGEVLAEALFGEFNPGGRLPVTWYPQSFTDVPMDDMAMRPDPSRGYPGRTYRFYTGPVIYEFGYGLSYSTYSYKFIYAPATISLSTSSVLQMLVTREPASETSDGLDYIHIDRISSCEALKFNIIVSVANDGDMDGSDVILIYSRQKRSIKGSPLKQLIGFDRVKVKAKGSTETSILVDPCKHLSNVNEEGERVLVLGDHVTMLGDLEHVVSIEI